MNARVRSVIWLVTILTLSVVMAGCTGGGSADVSNEKQIRTFLKEMEVALRSMDAEKIAGLWHYPVVIEGEEISKEDMQAAFHLIIRDAQRYGLVIHEFRIMVSDSDILVDSSGERAVVYNVKFYTRVSIEGEEYPGETADGPPLELMKRGGKWKLSSLLMFLDM